MDMMTDIPSPLPTLARYAIMVDVGYIYAAAGELLFSSASRREYRVDTDKLIQALTRQADGQVRGELLRVYWYDAARDRVPTIDQRVIAQMAWVKLRLGNLNARGQQKGVDAQIRADMEALARHRAITDAVLSAGDEHGVGDGAVPGQGLHVRPDLRIHPLLLAARVQVAEPELHPGHLGDHPLVDRGHPVPCGVVPVDPEQ